MIAVFVFLTVSLAAAIIGSIVIWSFDARRADEIESTPPLVPQPVPVNRQLPPAA